MQYYEDEFNDFEDYLQFTGQQVQSTRENPHANSDYVLERYANFENWRKEESRKLRKQAVNKEIKVDKTRDGKEKEKAMVAKSKQRSNQIVRKKKVKLYE